MNKSHVFLTITLVIALLVSYLPLNLEPAQPADVRSDGLSRPQATPINNLPQPISVAGLAQPVINRNAPLRLRRKAASRAWPSKATRAINCWAAWRLM